MPRAKTAVVATEISTPWIPSRPLRPWREASWDKILRSDQDDKFAFKAGFGETRLDVTGEADEEGLVQLRHFLRDADDAIGAENLDDFRRELVDPVAALVKRQREVEVAILVEK